MKHAYVRHSKTLLHKCSGTFFAMGTARKFISPKNNVFLCLSRSEASVQLKDIREFHVKLHADKFPRHELAQQLSKVQIGFDGVQPSKAGQRTLYVISVRIGRCLYPWKVTSPLIGNKKSRPHVVDLFG